MNKYEHFLKVSRFASLKNAFAYCVKRRKYVGKRREYLVIAIITESPDSCISPKTN